MPGARLLNAVLADTNLQLADLDGASFSGASGWLGAATDTASFSLISIHGTPTGLPDTWRVLPFPKLPQYPASQKLALLMTPPHTFNYVDGTSETWFGFASGTPWDTRDVLGELFGAGVDISGDHVDLRNADFSNFNLQNSNLSGSDMSGADLHSADAGGTAVPADASSASAAASKRYGAKLFRVRLTGADLTGAKLKYAGLAGVVTGSIRGRPTSVPTGWKLTAGYLVGPTANLTGANLAGAALAGIKLATATITGLKACGIASKPASLPKGWVSAGSCLIGPRANLKGADLRKLDFGKASLAGTDLTGANIAGAKLANATLGGVVSTGLIGAPTSLPKGWKVVAGQLVKS